MECRPGNRCVSCLKKMYKMEVQRYQKLHAEVFDGKNVDSLGNLVVAPTVLQSLLNQRVKIGKAYRRWQRRRESA